MHSSLDGGSSPSKRARARRASSISGENRARSLSCGAFGTAVCPWRLTEFGPTEITANIQLLDESGTVLVELEGFVCRSTGSRTQALNGSLYEYQWKFAPRPATAGVRDSRHIASPEALAPVMQETGEALRKRLDRKRYQDEFLALSRSVAAAYIVRALRELGWAAAACAAMPIESLADRLGVAPQYHGWLRLILKELSADDIASTEEPRRLWKRLWDEFPDCQAEIMLGRICGEKLPAVLKGDVDPLSLLFPEGALTDRGASLSGCTNLARRQSAGAEGGR